MSKEKIISMLKKHGQSITIVADGIIVGKAIADFVRKDTIGKVIAVAELGIGLTAAAFNIGIVDYIVSNATEPRAEVKDDPNGESYDPEPYDPDEDGFNPNEFDEFINSGESPEYDDEDEETDPKEEETDPEEE